MRTYDPVAIKEDFIDLAAQALGRRGGKKTLEKYGKDYFKEMSKKGVEAKLLKKRAPQARIGQKTP